MPLFLKALFILAVLGVVGAADGEEAQQNYAVRSWEREQGVPQSTVNAVVQTRDGYIWIATYGGVARFDGQRFTVFDGVNTPVLGVSGVSCFFEDHEGALWMANEAGAVLRYMHGVFQQVRDYPRRGFEHIIEDSSHDIWLLDRNRELLRVRDSYTIPCAVNESRRWTIPAFAHDASSGGNWVLREGSLGLLKNGQVSAVQLQHENLALGIGPSLRGGVWIVAPNHLERWEAGKFVEEIETPKWPDFIGIPAVCELPDGSVAVGTTDRGVYVFARNGSLQVFDQRNRLSDNWVKSLLVDREGTLWAGLGNAGLTAIQPVTFEACDPPDRWDGRPLTSVFRGFNGRLWAGTEGAGLYLRENGTWTHTPIDADAANAYVWSVCELNNGDLWVGTWGAGIFRRRDNRFKKVPDLAKPYQYAPVFFVDHRRTFWVASQMGVYRFEGDNPVLCVTPDQLSNARVRAIGEDASGKIWLVPESAGLAVLENGILKRYRVSDGLPNDSVGTIFFDDDQTLWLSTLQGGLSFMKDGKFATIKPEEGFAPDIVRYITQDKLGYFWLGTRSGIVRVKKQDLLDRATGKKASIDSRTFGTADGLSSIESAGTGCQSSDGWFWFPTRRGLVRARPDKIVANSLPPPVQIERLTEDGEAVALPENSASVARARAGGARYVFNYTALSFIAPEYVHFKYRMRGVDLDWVDAREVRTATYGLLSPGNYIFEVMAANSHGTWNPTPAQVRLTVPPFFWQTWWARLAGVFAASAALGGAIAAATQRRWRIKMEEVERQSELERERNRIAKDIHDDLGASLTRITLLTQSARKELPAHSDQSAAHIEQIYSAAREVTKSLDEIVWAVNPNHDSLESIATYVAKFAQDFLSAAGVSCRWELPIDLPAWPISSEVRHTVFLAYKEALNNVVRHAQATRVVISLVPQDDHFILSVADNGIGFVDEARVRSNGGGNGLVNMRTRLHEVGGNLEIQSTPNHGSCLRFIVPFKRAS